MVATALSAPAFLPPRDGPGDWWQSCPRSPMAGPGRDQEEKEQRMDATRFLVVIADDYGIGPETSRGILELAARGVVTGTVLLVNSPFAEDAIRAWRRFGSRLEMGDPCLTLDRPSAPCESRARPRRPGNGRLLSLRHFLARLYLHQIVPGRSKSNYTHSTIAFSNWSVIRRRSSTRISTPRCLPRSAPSAKSPERARCTSAVRAPCAGAVVDAGTHPRGAKETYSLDPAGSNRLAPSGRVMVSRAMTGWPESPIRRGYVSRRFSSVG